MIVTDILQFLGELQENNTYEWMQAHKSWYIQYAFYLLNWPTTALFAPPCGKNAV